MYYDETQEQDWSNYIPDAMRTSSDKVGSYGQESCDLAHAALGINTEWREYLEASTGEHAAEELGDLCWFIALALTALGTTTIPALKADPDDITTPEAIAQLQNIAKDWFAYGVLSDDQRGEALFALSVIAAHLFRHHDVGTLQRKNISKLSARYPEAWNQQDALERDTEAECEAMRRA